MSKAILVIDTDFPVEEHYGKKLLIDIYNDEENGYQYLFTENAILKPMPEKKPLSQDRGKNHCEYSLLDRLEYQKGFNDCVNEILGEEE